MINKMSKCVIVISITLFFCFVARAQNAKERTLLTAPWENEPIKIIRIESVQGPLRSGKAVARSETWLQGLSVRVQNTSDKTIVSLMYVLTIYGDGKSGQNPIGTELRYGELGSENSNAAPIPPGGEAVISLSEDRLGDLAKIVKARKKPMDDIVKTRLILQVVCFDDRTCWVGGNIVPAESFTTTQSQISGQSIQQHYPLTPTVDNMYCDRLDRVKAEFLSANSLALVAVRNRITSHGNAQAIL